MPEDQDSPEQASDLFLFHDFFTDEEDKGVEISVQWGGKMLPFRIKHSLTLGERQRVNNAGIQIDVDASGKPILTKQDQSAFTEEVLVIGLKYWPFEYAPGKPVPITRKTIAQLDNELASVIAARILGGTLVNVKALAPFVKRSGEG